MFIAPERWRRPHEGKKAEDINVMHFFLLWASRNGACGHNLLIYGCIGDESGALLELRLSSYNFFLRSYWKLAREAVTVRGWRCEGEVQDVNAGKLASKQAPRKVRSSSNHKTVNYVYVQHQCFGIFAVSNIGILRNEAFLKTIISYYRVARADSCWYLVEILANY